MGYTFPGLQISIRGVECWGYRSPGLQITIRGEGRWGYRSPGIQISIRGGRNEVPLSWFTNKY